MKKLFVCSSLTALMALVIVGINAGNQTIGLNAVAVPDPTTGDLQALINAAAPTNYTKTTHITSYNGTSLFPYAAHNPLNTEYTQEGLCMTERGSGYYTYNKQIWQAKKVDNVWNKFLSMTNYESYDAFYKTLKDFDGSFIDGHFAKDTSEGNDGVSFKNKARAFSDLDIVAMIYFVAPLVTIDDAATFSNYSFVFKVRLDGSSYVLDSLSINVDITVDSKVATLISSATFSKIGSTTLDYTI